MTRDMRLWQMSASTGGEVLPVPLRERTTPQNSVAMLNLGYIHVIRTAQACGTTHTEAHICLRMAVCPRTIPNGSARAGCLHGGKRAHIVNIRPRQVTPSHLSLFPRRSLIVYMGHMQNIQRTWHACLGIRCTCLTDRPEASRTCFASTRWYYHLSSAAISTGTQRARQYIWTGIIFLLLSQASLDLLIDLLHMNSQNPQMVVRLHAD